MGVLQRYLMLCLGWLCHEGITSIDIKLFAPYYPIIGIRERGLTAPASHGLSGFDLRSVTFRSGGCFEATEATAPSYCTRTDKCRGLIILPCALPKIAYNQSVLLQVPAIATETGRVAFLLLEPDGSHLFRTSGEVRSQHGIAGKHS